MQKQAPLLIATCLTGLIQAQPNIVTILVDDLGWNHLSASKATLNTQLLGCHTPHISALAKNGCSFAYAYMQANCAPTRACLLTGQYPARDTNGVYNVESLDRYQSQGPYSRANAHFDTQKQSEDISPKAITIARALKRFGYTTAHIGKYHVGGHLGPQTLPQQMGFDINVGGNAQGHQPLCIAKKVNGTWCFPGLGNGDFDSFAKPYTQQDISQLNIPQTLIGKPKHISDAFDQAVDHTINQLFTQDKPFYLQVHTYAVHGPVVARQDLYQAAKKAYPSLSPMQAHYRGFITSVDNTVGRIIQKLKDPNQDGKTDDSILPNTIIVFASDNGGTHATNAPLKGEKGMHTEGGTRVPLIVSWLGKIPPNTLSKRSVHAVDYYPTFLAFANATPLQNPPPLDYPLDGYSFAQECLNPGSTAPRPPIFWYFPGYLDTRSQPLISILTTHQDGMLYRWTYRYEQNDYQLYNITQDPGETTNLVNTQQPLSRKLHQESQQWLHQKSTHWKPLKIIPRKQ